MSESSVAVHNNANTALSSSSSSTTNDHVLLAPSTSCSLSLSQQQQPINNVQPNLSQLPGGMTMMMTSTCSYPSIPFLNTTTSTTNHASESPTAGFPPPLITASGTTTAASTSSNSLGPATDGSSSSSMMMMMMRNSMMMMQVDSPLPAASRLLSSNGTNAPTSPPAYFYQDDQNHKNSSNEGNLAGIEIDLTSSPCSNQQDHPPQPQGSTAITDLSMIKPEPAESVCSANEEGGGGGDPNSNTVRNNVGGTNNNRRQKRLERNRESARLSRRRRKQYLEVLEERVAQLSEEMDRGRRGHVAQALNVIRVKRAAAIASVVEQSPSPQTQPQQQQTPSLHSLPTMMNGVRDGGLFWPSSLSPLLTPSLHHVGAPTCAPHAPNNKNTTTPAQLFRTSGELQVAAVTFGSQQLQSFCAPPAHKFTLWLTLQADDFFRGGRAASERLSAARIGERMLHNGTDRATPSQTMWPLFCNEIGLSYDQEEKVRNYQRSLLQVPESWLSRHASLAGSATMKAAHEATHAVSVAMGSRERRTAAILTPQQYAKLSGYLSCQPNYAGSQSSLSLLRQKLQNSYDNRHDQSQATARSPVNGKTYELSTTQHVAANLYILNHRLSQILQRVPAAAPLVTGPALKKLSRRPSFESLGARSGEKCLDSDSASPSSSSHPLSRDSPNASCGSLKRSASEMSVDDTTSGGDERQQAHVRPSIDPVAAQVCAADVIEQTLGHVKDIMPLAAPSYQNGQHHLQGAQPEGTTSAPLLDDVVDVDDVDLMRLNGEPLPDPVPVAVLSSTPFPAGSFLVPLASMESGGNSSSIPNSNGYHPFLTGGNNEPNNSKQQRRSASHGCLGVVPEEIWSSEAAEDFLMSFVDGDWAVGGGIQTDMA